VRFIMADSQNYHGSVRVRSTGLESVPVIAVPEIAIDLAISVPSPTLDPLRDNVDLRINQISNFFFTF